ncbi:MAG TPA: MATE family efflux transporter [Candidatus Scatomorpha merdavium]|nr:MATE family efflux transporter [Candidatus Scatomorpha merdavium]
MTRRLSVTAAERDLTNGPVFRQMVLFALPHMLTSALQIAYSAVDLAIVGHAVSGAALSAVSVSGHVLNLVTMLGLGFSTGGQVYMAQLLGMDRRSECGRVTATLLTATSAVAIVLALICAVFNGPILRLMNTPAEAYDMAVQYLVIGSAGLIFTFMYNGLAAIVRAFGDSQTPLYAILAASAVNILLDLLFVVVFQWAVVGAILATVIGQVLSALILLVAMLRGRERFGLDTSRENLRPNRSVLRSITFLAIPYALEMTVFNVSMLFISSMVNDVSLVASETFGIGLKVEEIGNKLCTGITCATSVMVAQSIASGNIERTKKIVHAAWIFGGCMYLLFGLLCFTMSKQLFSLFVDDAAVIANAPMFIKALSFGFPAMASMRATNGLMQGVSNAKLSLIIGVLDGIAVRIPLSYMLGIILGYGLWGFFLAYSLAAYTNALLGMGYYLSGRWKHRRLAVQQ